MSYVCSICNRDLTEAAKVLNISSDEMRNIHEGAHIRAETRTLYAEILKLAKLLPPELVSNIDRIKSSIDILDRIHEANHVPA